MVGAIVYGASFLLRIDTVQQQVASHITTALQKAGDIPLSIGSIQVRHLNKVVLKNICLTDEAGDTAVNIPQITAHLSPLDMFKGYIRVNTLIIGNPAITLCRESDGSPLNIQFILDKLAGNDTDKKTTLPDIRINQIQLYDGTFTYNIKDRERSPLFDAAHINVGDINCNLSLKLLNSDTISLNIRSISGKEKKGLTLKRLSAVVEANATHTHIGKLLIKLPGSELEAKKITLSPQGDNHTAIKGELTSNRITLGDFASLHPALHAKLPTLATDIKINDKQGETSSKINLRTADKSLALQLEATIKNLLQPQKTTVSVTQATLTPDAVSHIQKILCDSTAGLEILKRAGNINITGQAHNDKNGTRGEIEIKSNNGNILASANIDKEDNCNATLKIQRLHLGNILQNNDLGTCDIESRINGRLTPDTTHINTAATIKNLNYKNYTYSPIQIDYTHTLNDIRAAIKSNDPNACGTLAFSLTKGAREDIKFAATIDSLKLDSLNIGSGNIGTISATSDGSYHKYENGKSLLDIRIYNITKETDKEQESIRMLQIVDNNLLDNRSLIINSDFLDAKIAGQFTYPSLVGTFKKIINNHTPALAQTQKESHANNAYIFSLNIRNTLLISSLLNLPVTIHGGSTITGQCDDNRKLFLATATLNDTDIKENKFHTIEAHLFSNDSTAGFRSVLKCRPASSPQPQDNTEASTGTTININTLAADNHITAKIDWEGANATENKGALDLGLTLARDNDKTKVDARLLPSKIIHDGTLWQLSECSIKGTDEMIAIENFALVGDKKRVRASGHLGKTDDDKFSLQLENIKLENILDIVDFHSVEFGGHTTGEVAINSLFNHPQFNCSLQVDSFTFEKGYMGDLTFKGSWNEEEKAVVMRGDIHDTDKAHTIVEGFVSPANDTINLCVKADRMRIAFLNSMLAGIISDVEATSTGNISIRGPLGGINLVGSASVAGSMRAVTTNTTYTLLNDSVKLTPNKITLENLKIFDRHKNRGVVNGNIYHEELDNFTCDIDITADNLLAYHSTGFDSNPFYGTVYATGKANITANNKGLFIHADVSNNKNSSFVYDASEVAAVTNHNFIKFSDRNKKNLPSLKREKESNKAQKSFLSRLNLEFMIDVTPDMLLKVYTNRRTGDYIDIYGSGPISAVYDEKEGFSMTGRLDLERGTYRFTMQDIFLKEFDITRGSSLEFNGDPFDAELDLRTKYLVPSASLSDLDPSGRRHKSVKVNCLMDITGKLEAPQLAFDIELPDAGEEERELLASTVNTPEQKNTQFVYLLGIGKFYTYDYNSSEAGSQSSSAMESLISNTLSGQLNNLLSQIIDNRNWNFSGNFSSSERGWNSMEVEGILEGRLLDNRLLINGNFGYRENPLANSNFIGDFEVQWLLDKNGKLSLKAYNKTNERYFTESSLNTQGAGIILRHDFNNWRWWLKNNKEKREKEKNK